jgi:transposase
MTRRNIYNIIQRAKDCGYNPEVDPRILEEYVVDAEGSGCPKLISESTKQAVIDSITNDRARCEESAEYLAYEAGISQSSVSNILKQSEFTKTKPTWKPGLADDMKKRRLAFCRALADWPFE